MTVSVFDYEAELTACAAGDSAAFHALYRHEAPVMRALALAMLGAPDEADAVLHEAFVLIWRNAAGYSPSIGTARAWMYSILRYRALDHLRRQRAAGDTAAEQQPLPELSLPGAGRPGTIQGVLAALPAPQLDALLQAYLHGGDPARIADRLDRSEPDIQASIESVLTHIDEAVRA
ncbi:sigma factor [uncultured Castellaniella sp.]|uniref:sigma factor n=1 Tax=uncultured Castellaniella sp. TaxID=647907 RepID=UPI00262D364C|nr:sigma factor [uncultured Castellaniella sp.]